MWLEGRKSYSSTCTIQSLSFLAFLSILAENLNLAYLESLLQLSTRNPRHGYFPRVSKYFRLLFHDSPAKRHSGKREYQVEVTQQQPRELPRHIIFRPLSVTASICRYFTSNFTSILPHHTSSLTVSPSLIRGAIPVRHAWHCCTTCYGSTPSVSSHYHSHNMAMAGQAPVNPNRAAFT